MRLLIADDDDYTREGLSESFDWEKYGINEILLAADGAEALRIATVKKPDIVLTDIRMPKLNGIEFAEKLAEKSPDSQLLFMSGYMDVEYLKSAIKLSAIEYIEKPIKLAEVEQAIHKSVRSLQSKQEQTAVIQQKNELVRQKLAAMLRDEHADKAAVQQLCNDSGFPTDQRYWGIIVWNRLDSKDEQADIQQIVQYWRENGVTAIGDQLDRRHCFIVLAYDRHDYKRLSFLNDVFINRYAQYNASIGKAANHIHELPSSFRAAERAMERSFYRSDIRCFHDLEEERSSITETYSNFLPAFYEARANDPEKLPELIKSACAGFRENEFPFKERVVALFDTVIQGTIGKEPKHLAALENDYGIRDVEKFMHECRTLDEMEQLMLAICSVWLEETLNGSQYSRLIKYISANYRNVDLDLRMIAEHMHLSTAHLGLLFKQETGSTIKQYISDYRMEVAKKLVASEHLKMNAIAELCGFASASYFAKVFKASTDLSPLEYRKKI
jgi:two-component system response regulator YesN